MGEFLQMGGYGAYVWPAYLLTVVVLSVMAVATLRAYQKSKRLLHQLEDSSTSN